MSGNGSTESIRELNDRLRRENLGGEWMLTRGITTLGIDRVASVVHAVMLFDDFTSDNDPYGEHDCAVMKVEDVEVIWKIDYYDKSMEYGSPDPSDPTVTKRILTVMLASDY